MRTGALFTAFALALTAGALLVKTTKQGATAVATATRQSQASDAQGNGQALPAPSSPSAASSAPVSPKLAPNAQALRAPSGQPSQPSSELSALTNELARLKGCYEKECGYPRTYPRSYDYAVGQDIKRTLFEMNSVVERDQLEAPEIAQLARDFLANDDGHVKEAALHLLSTQPPSPESLDALIEDVIKDFDPKLIEHALLELQRYSATADQEKIRQALAEAMITGAAFVSEEVASHISPFINEQSYLFFEGVSLRLSPGSRTLASLKASLVDYRRRRTGA